MSVDQPRTANLEGVHRWRILFHYHTGDHQDVVRVEMIAGFHVTADAAWADATALLSLAGCQQPHAITIERGTYTASPEGGYRWRHLHPTQHRRAGQTSPIASRLENRDRPSRFTAYPAAVIAASHQHPVIANPTSWEDQHFD